MSAAPSRAALPATALAGADAIPAEELLRVTTLNALHANSAVAERTELVADELAVLAPDVFCLQEVRFESTCSSAQLEALTAATGLRAVAALGQKRLADGSLSGNAILTRLETLEAGHLPLGVPGSAVHSAAYAVLKARPGRVLIAVSAHLHWGGEKERERLVQATAIDARVKQLMESYGAEHPMAVLAGDFNSVPDADTARFLSGRSAGADGGYTYWTDSFDVVGDPYEAATVANDNHWAVQTAKSVGILYPQLMPSRRIDYVWSYGWTYGKPGTPAAMSRSFTADTRYDFPASDHYGLTVDFWAPPVQPAFARLEEPAFLPEAEAVGAGW
ncbi:hypothetical protein GCM10027449_26800 [Sinomonas notoginsengisoli]|uniref:endonuclease/exonuclease/phosphatase family protein n=1 Tax=Sinomonas notoginsengisoli TaxID=1457311 RepID=UPI001F3418E0|nr:endonuclease/exonuclease/phosphatase family protein [Sinomonas notoginsengisoli]